VFRLTHGAVLLAPSEQTLDHLALALRESRAHVLGGASIDGRLVRRARTSRFQANAKNETCPRIIRFEKYRHDMLPIGSLTFEFVQARLHAAIADSAE
jgi:hypothetical protein